MNDAVLRDALLREVESFVFREARLADESQYAEWEALLTDDMHYWVPNGRADYDPATRLSYINDNRARLATRIRQLQTGLRHAQTPVSPMRRLVSNIEVLAVDEPADEVTVGANQVVYELNAQSTGPRLNRAVCCSGRRWSTGSRVASASVNCRSTRCR